MGFVLRRLFAFSFVLASVTSQAAWYFVEPKPETRQARVVIVLDEGQTAKEFRMPAWAPGDYEIFNYGTKIDQVVFKNKEAVVAATKGSDPNHWIIDGEATMVEYLVNESRGNFSPNLRVTADEMFVSGPGVMGWFVGHDREKHTLNVLTKAGETAACPLDPVETSFGGFTGFSAVDYDELIDSPFVVGKTVRVHQFMVEGKPHAVVGYNQSAGVDLAQFQDNANKLAIEAKRIFGELPYDRYYYFFDFGGPGGGLEHLDSTRIGLGARTTARGALGIMAHEYFHTFNVKRIRSAPLGPFDYTKPAVTGALWWLEGVTDYYADVISHRAGLTTREDFFATMAGNFNGLHRGSAFQRVSADESSRRVWETRGSNGFGGMSYYTKGAVVGFALDLAIRTESGNKHSLDDVIRDLYIECKGPRGFSETRIRELSIKYGGEKLGGVYDACVMVPGRIPIEPLLIAAGMRLEGSAFVADPTATAQQRAIGAAFPARLGS
jgi:predicted metalloprotease with PDZ domain